jgi:hypothetical protein
LIGGGTPDMLRVVTIRIRKRELIAVLVDTKSCER